MQDADCLGRSMGTAWYSNRQFPWEVTRWSGGIENVKINVTLRIYSNKWHVYAGKSAIHTISSAQAHISSQASPSSTPPPETKSNNTQTLSPSSSSSCSKTSGKNSKCGSAPQEKLSLVGSISETNCSSETISSITLVLERSPGRRGSLIPI